MQLVDFVMFVFTLMDVFYQEYILFYTHRDMIILDFMKSI